jgi:hypothetical protein
MAQTRASTPEIPEHPVVAKVVGDPSSTTATTRLVGYVGKSTRSEHVRLYTDPTFEAFVEIPKDKILHSETVPADRMELGGTSLWVKADAPLIAGSSRPPATAAAQASFLMGDISNQYLPAAGQSAQFPWPPTVFCPLTQFCPTNPLVCVSAACPTHSVVCHTIAVCPTLFECRTPVCPTSPHLCYTHFCPTSPFVCIQATHNVVCQSVVCPTRICPTGICPPVSLGCPIGPSGVQGTS